MTVVKRALKIELAGLVLVIGLTLAVAANGDAASAPTKGKQLLSDLIARVKQEGELNIKGLGGNMGPVARQMEQAFLNRFGLKIGINLVTAGEENQEWSKMQTAIKAGAPPEFDVYVGDDVKLALAKSEKLLKFIDNWDLLLAEVNPLVASGRVKPKQVSWGLGEGYGFAWHNRVYGVLYNPKLMSSAEMPQGIIDIANPRYKDKYVIAPFPTMWQYATLIYPKDKWLKVVEEVGKNAASVLTFDAGSERVSLGEFAFQPLATYTYYVIKGKNPNAPVAVHWPTDFVANSIIINAVPAKARHPAGGALWALWMTTVEAAKIWQPEIYSPNIMFGESAIDLEVRNALSELKKKGAKIISWFDDRETEAMLDWYGTKAGSAYRQQIMNALTQRK